MCVCASRYRLNHLGPAHHTHEGTALTSTHNQPIAPMRDGGGRLNMDSDSIGTMGVPCYFDCLLFLLAYLLSQRPNNAPVPSASSDWQIGGCCKLEANRNPRGYGLTVCRRCDGAWRTYARTFAATAGRRPGPNERSRDRATDGPGSAAAGWMSACRVFGFRTGST